MGFHRNVSRALQVLLREVIPQSTISSNVGVSILKCRERGRFLSGLRDIGKEEQHEHIVSCDVYEISTYGVYNLTEDFTGGYADGWRERELIEDLLKCLTPSIIPHSAYATVVMYVMFGGRAGNY